LNNTLSNNVKQDISRFKIFIIDNASTEVSFEVVKEYDKYVINYFVTPKIRSPLAI
jgi:uncharacterized protein (UPF0248 family)